METYQVKIYPTAAQDLSDIVDYLNTLSPTVALKTYDDLVEEISSLLRFLLEQEKGFFKILFTVI